MKKIFCSFIALCLLSFSACAQSQKSTKEDSDMTSTKINVTVNGIINTATLVDNSSTKALVELLKKGDVIVHTDDYGGFEKVGEFGSTLPQNNTQINTNPGDIILYLGNKICFYYGTNSWNFTRLGKLDMTDEKEIRKFLNAGNGKTEIVLRLLK